MLIYLTKKDCELFDMDQFSTLTEQEFTTFAMTHPAGNFLETPEMKHLLERRGRPTNCCVYPKQEKSQNWLCFRH